MNLVFENVMSIPFMKALGAHLKTYSDAGVSVVLPYRPDLVISGAEGIMAGGALTAVLDQTCGMAVWLEMGRFQLIATLDLRIDYMRPAEPGRDVEIVAKCYRLTRSIGFVRAFAYDGHHKDPVAAAQAAFALTQAFDSKTISAQET